MTLIKWSPFETLANLEEDLNQIFAPGRQGLKKGQSAEANWLPAVDIHEDPEAYHFDVEAPGVSKDQFHVTVEDSVLTIKGERKREEKKEGANYYRVEREYGSFSRSFTLPETANPEKVNAEYRDGVLQVKIQKREAAKPKRIDVKVAA